jgi:hypothetical protein
MLLLMEADKEEPYFDRTVTGDWLIAGTTFVALVNLGGMAFVIFTNSKAIQKDQKLKVQQKLKKKETLKMKKSTAVMPVESHGAPVDTDRAERLSKLLQDEDDDAEKNRRDEERRKEEERQRIERQKKEEENRRDEEKRKEEERQKIERQKKEEENRRDEEKRKEEERQKKEEENRKYEEKRKQEEEMHRDEEEIDWDAFSDEENESAKHTDGVKITSEIKDLCSNIVKICKNKQRFEKAFAKLDTNKSRQFCLTEFVTFVRKVDKMSKPKVVAELFQLMLSTTADYMLSGHAELGCDDIWEFLSKHQSN